MSEDTNVPGGSETPPEPQSAFSEETWKEVGRQFEALGESLAAAFRTAWQDENNQRRVQEMRAGVESMLTEVSQAIQEGSQSPEAQKLREDAAKAAETTRAAVEKGAQEARPHLLNAMKEVSQALQRAIEDLEGKKGS